MALSFELNSCGFVRCVLVHACTCASFSFVFAFVSRGPVRLSSHTFAVPYSSLAVPCLFSRILCRFDFFLCFRCLVCVSPSSLLDVPALFLAVFLSFCSFCLTCVLYVAVSSLSLPADQRKAIEKSASLHKLCNHRIVMGCLSQA